MNKTRSIQSKDKEIFRFKAILFLLFLCALVNQSCGKYNSNEGKSSENNRAQLITTESSALKNTTEINEDEKQSNEIILIGIDGADKDVVDKLISLGKLPNIQRLIKNGSYGKLHSIKPLLSPIIWTSIATGKSPLKHGITDFLALDPKSGKEIPVTSNLRKVKALWNIFSEQGRSAGVIGWLATWPAEKINGYIISDHIAYLDYDPHSDGVKNKKGMVYPESLFKKLQPFIIDPDSILQKRISNFIKINKNKYSNDLIFNAASVIASTETIQNISSYLYKNPPVLPVASPRGEQADKNVDLRCIYFKGIDSFSHLFASSSSGQKLIDNPIGKFYVYQDSLIGDFLKPTGKSATVIIVSDHGFKLTNPSAGSSKIGKGNAVDWHTDNGIIIMSGENIKKGEKIDGASVLDIAPTILYLSGLAAADDMDGKILTDVIQESYSEKHKVKKVKSYESPDKAEQKRIPIPSEKDEIIKEQLETLGYLNTGTGNSFNNIGNLYMNERKYQLALKSFKKAVELEPKVAAYHDNLGSAYSALEMYDQAIEAHKRAIYLNPNFEEAYNNLGRAYSDLGKNQSALQNYKKAIELDPNFALALNNIGELYYKQKEIGKALKFIQDALEKNPGLALAHYNLAVLLGEKGNHYKAIEEFKKVLEIDPNFKLLGNVYNGLGVAYFHLKEYGKALDNFKEAERINPEFSQIHLRLAICYANLGSKGKALEELRKELELDPENKSVKDFIKSLENDYKQ